MTRTLYIGSPSQKEIDTYYTVLHTQREAIRRVKDGANAVEIDKFTRDKLGNYFHGLGHGIGLDIHEAPALSPVSKAVLKENMVITIEPGFYRRGAFGIRIEDDVLVTKTGAKVLSRFPKDLIMLRM